MTKKINEIIIWDQNNLPKNNKNVFLWNKRSEDFNSIINFIDDNSIKIKNNILDLFGKFGNSKINNSNIIDFYNLEKNFSYWQLSFFVEKNFYKKNFFDIIKILALELLINKKNFSYITLYTSNIKLIEFFENYCLKKKIYLKIKLSNIKKKKISNFGLKNFKRILFFIFNRVNFKKNKFLQNNIFFSYFENNDNNLKKSIYWSNLFDRINKKEIVQIFIPSKNFTNIRKIKNKNLKFLDYEFDIFILLKIIFSYLKINLLNNKVEVLANQIFVNNSISYWPILKPYWDDSFKSINLFKNLYYYYLIKKIVSKKIFKHKNLFYLFENQPWERCLCFFYKKKFSKKKLFGISHTPIRFWDLRFFNSKIVSLKNYSPNYISFVNKYSQNIYKKDYDTQNKIKLEALRYNNFTIKFNTKNKKKILIIGDYLDSENFMIKSLLSKITSLKKNNFLYLSHPANTKNIDQNYKLLKSKNDLKNFNVSKVIIPHMSTSVIEYLFNKKDIIVFLNDNMPNMSPLFMNITKVKYVFDLKSLKKNLSKKQHNLDYKHEQLKPFRVNKELIYWKKLLSNDFKK